MKRELAFASGDRSQILDSAGKTRSNRALNARSNGVSASRSRKRVKGEEPVAFDRSIVEVKDSGISSSVCDEPKKDLVDNVVDCRNVGFGDLAGHCEDVVVEDGQMVESRSENGLVESRRGTEVETMTLDEPVAVDNSIPQVKEPGNRVNGCLEVEGNHFQDDPVEVERKDSESGLVEKTCEIELETAVVREEKANTTNRFEGELQDQCNGNLNLDNGLVAPLKSQGSELGLGNGALEKTPETEIGKGSKSERSLAVEELTTPDENLKTYAERPQRRFTHSVLRDSNKDDVDSLDMETNMTSTASGENLVAVNLKHSSGVFLDVSTEEPRENRDADGNRSESQNNIEMGNSKPVLITKVPVTVRELFETGILEGCPVFYNGGKKGPGMRGVIKGLGILCSCELCKGCKVVPPSHFEIHACNTYKCAAQYICLENGRSFIDILQLCRRTKLKGVQETLQNAVGPLPQKQLVVCQNCKESYSTSNVADRDPMCNSCTIKMYPTQKQLGAAVKLSRSPACASTSKTSGATSVLNTVRGRNSGIDRSPRPISTLKSTEEASLLSSLRNRSSGIHRLPVKGLKVSKSSRTVQVAKVSVGKAKASHEIRESTKAVSISKKSLRGQGKIRRSKKPSESAKKAGKITKKDLSMHGLVFGEAGLPDGTELSYFTGGKRLLDGYKRGMGIFCHCCSEVVSASQFEAHAGFASRRKPYSHIYTSNGVSLHELAVTLLQSSKRDLKGNDDQCVMCAEGGKLLPCDSCPKAFHLGHDLTFFLLYPPVCVARIKHSTRTVVIDEARALAQVEAASQRTVPADDGRKRKRRMDESEDDEEVPLVRKARNRWAVQEEMREEASNAPSKPPAETPITTFTNPSTEPIITSISSPELEILESPTNEVPETESVEVPAPVLPVYTPLADEGEENLSIEDLRNQFKSWSLHFGKAIRCLDRHLQDSNRIRNESIRAKNTANLLEVELGKERSRSTTLADRLQKAQKQAKHFRDELKGRIDNLIKEASSSSSQAEELKKQALAIKEEHAKCEEKFTKLTLQISTLEAKLKESREGLRMANEYCATANSKLTAMEAELVKVSCVRDNLALQVLKLQREIWPFPRRTIDRFIQGPYFQRVAYEAAIGQYFTGYDDCRRKAKEQFNVDLPRAFAKEDDPNKFDYPEHHVEYQWDAFRDAEKVNIFQRIRYMNISLNQLSPEACQMWLDDEVRYKAREAERMRDELQRLVAWEAQVRHWDEAAEQAEVQRRFEILERREEEYQQHLLQCQQRQREQLAAQTGTGSSSQAAVTSTPSSPALSFCSSPSSPGEIARENRLNFD